MPKEKKKSYDSDEDEANPLVIEEDEPLHIDEHESDNEENKESRVKSEDLSKSPNVSYFSISFNFLLLKVCSSKIRCIRCFCFHINLTG